MPKIDELFQSVVDQEGSDLHLLEGQPPRIRINGVMKVQENHQPLSRTGIMELLNEICPPERWEVFRKSTEVDFGYSLGNKARFRANYFNHFNGLGAIFRLIPNEIVSLDELKSPEVLKRFASAPTGIIIVAGPTGSGKSTTLAGMVNHINVNFNRKILTLEDPIEFIHQNKKSIIIQRAVGIDTPKFSNGLEDALRSDFDVVLVGEMRDAETMSLALSAASKGMLVFATVHTNSAIKTIDRIINAFPVRQHNQVRTMLANSLYGICAQMLLKTVDGSRIAAHEILIKTPSLANMILLAETHKAATVIQTGRSQGMQFMDDVIADLCRKGKISKNEAYLKANNKERFALL